MESDKQLIRQLAEPVGGVVELARRLGLSRAAVSAWQRVPILRVREVSAITGVPPERIRPDVFQ